MLRYDKVMKCDTLSRHFTEFSCSLFYISHSILHEKIFRIHSSSYIYKLLFFIRWMFFFDFIFPELRYFHLFLLFITYIYYTLTNIGQTIAIPHSKCVIRVLIGMCLYLLCLFNLLLFLLRIDELSPSKTN